MKAIALISGGLDGLLAARILLDQGIEVLGIHFSTGFIREDRTVFLEGGASSGRALRIAERDLARSLSLGEGASLPLEVQDVAATFLRDVVLRPVHGYGSAMNPCIDCRIFMLRAAGSIADERGFDIVATGEVLGQTRMSQRRESLDRIREASGLGPRLLRPLSARLLAPAEAERDGRIRRASLGALHGRSRREQLAMASRIGIASHPAPGSGCCLLADPRFARRLRDLLEHRSEQELAREEVDLLRIGRHFRLAHDLKVVVARDEDESRHLRELAGPRWTCQALDERGAVVLVVGDPGSSGFEQVASIAARYSSARTTGRVDVRFRRGAEEIRLEAAPAEDLHGLLE